MDLDAGMDALVLQGADQLQPRAVAHVGQALVGVSAEMADVDVALAVAGAVEHRSPFFQFPHPVGGLLGVDLGHAPMVAQVAADHGIAEMLLPGIAGIDGGQRRRDAALGHDRVGLAQQGFADEPGLASGRRGLDGGPQSRSAGADD